MGSALRASLAGRASKASDSSAQPPTPRGRRPGRSLARSDTPAPSQLTTSAPQDRAAARLPAGASVLILDPDGGLVSASAAELLRTGFELHTLPQGAGLRSALSIAPAITLVSLKFAAHNPAFVDMFRDRRDPVILIVPRGQTEVGIQALEDWADDLLVEPVNALELVARVRAVLRRANRGAAPALSVLGFRIDPIRRQLTTPDGQVIALTPQQMGVLVVLASSPGEIVSRRALSDAVRRQGYEASERSIDNQISRLRRKLESSGGPSLIRTAYGRGYAVDPH